jgi:hypothetical protein
MIGNTAARKMMKMFCASLIPNQSMDSGIHASGGIGRKNPTTGSTDHAK